MPFGQESNLGLGGIIFSDNVGTKLHCYLAGQLTFSGCYSYMALLRLSKNPKHQKAERVSH
jgi:hypothetical protein